MSSHQWLEVKYLNLVSHKLPLFKRRDERVYNFRCPYCGDSAKNKFRARGYIYERQGHLQFRCHNCGEGKKFNNFLRDLDQNVYNEYRFELFKEIGSQRSAPKRDEIPPDEAIPESANNDDFDPLRSLKSLDKFDSEFVVKRYLLNRLIPEEHHSKLYYVTRFMEWVNTVIPGKFDADQLRMDEPRLVIPFRDASGKVFAVTGRSFKSKSTVKYLTVKFDEEVTKIYGMDSVDPSKRVYIFEGPIDSFFIPNSIAFAGSSGRVPEFADSVIVLDNEPRNREIVKLNMKFVEQGRKICVWPSSMSEHKDVNDMIIAGKTADEVKKIIDDNTYSGLAAKLVLSAWKAV